MSSWLRPALRLRGSRACALAIVLATGLVALSVTHVQAAPAPTVAVAELRAYRNVVQTGDLFFLVRYELSLQLTAFPTPVTTPEAWCQYLRTQTGCTGSAASPTDPTSLQPNYALASLYSSCNTDCSTGTLEQQEQPPRVGHGLAGFYVSPGHTLTWGSTAMRGCIEASSAVFAPSARSCTSVNWNTAASTASAQLTQLGGDLRTVLRTLEPLRAVPRNTYVSNNLVTTAGRVLAYEALPGLERLIPTYFQAASQAAGPGFATPNPATPLALQQRLDATATATAFGATLGATGSALLGVSGGAFATILFFALGGVAAGFMFKLTQQPVLAVLAFIAPPLVGMFVRGPSVSAVLVGVAALALPAVFFVVKKMA